MIKYNKLLKLLKKQTKTKTRWEFLSRYFYQNKDFIFQEFLSAEYLEASDLKQRKREL